LFIDLTPFVPLSLKGEGEEILERGSVPLKPPILLSPKKGELKRDFASLIKTVPLPLSREGG